MIKRSICILKFRYFRVGGANRWRRAERASAKISSRFVRFRLVRSRLLNMCFFWISTVKVYLLPGKYSPELYGF